LKTGLWPHLFTAIGKLGNVIELKFWAWGEREDQAMQNLDGVFWALDGCLKAISPLFKGGDQI
jgi:hypothetical protein